MRSKFESSAAAAITGLFISGACMPAWSGTGVTKAPALNADVMLVHSATPSVPVLPSWIGASRGDVTSPQDRTNCKVGHIYSQHDIVGDPEACIMGALTISGRGAAP